MFVLKAKVIDCPLRVMEPVRLGFPSKGRDDALKEETLVEALDSIEVARQRLNWASKELDRLERRWKRLTQDD